MSAIRSNQSLTRAQVEDLVRHWLTVALDQNDLKVAKFRPRNQQELRDAIETAEDYLESARLFAFTIRGTNPGKLDARALLHQAGVTSPDEDTVDRFADLYQRAHVELYSFILARLKGEVWKGVQDPVFETPPTSSVPSAPVAAADPAHRAPSEAQTLESLSAAYIDREIRPSTSAKNVVKASAHLRTFVEIVGPDRSLASVNRTDLSDFRGVLERLPSNVSKFFPDQPLRKVAEANHKKPTLSPSSINEALTRIGAFLNWCRYHGYTDSDLSTTRLKVKKVRRAKEARTPFKPAELDLLFKGPIYSGCKSRARRNHPGEFVIRDATYFLPLLGLLTGARLGELLGLTPEDISGDAGRRVIHIRPNDVRTLKNEASERVVPLHSVLEGLGFGRFLRGRTALKRPIFDHHAKVRGGNITNNASRWFSDHLEAIGVKRTGLSFHSFRHHFEDMARASGVPEDLRRALLGHTQAGMGAIYGGVDEGFTLEQRRQAIEGLKLPVDLSVLNDLAGRPGKRLVMA